MFQSFTSITIFGMADSSVVIKVVLLIKLKLALHL